MYSRCVVYDLLSWSCPQVPYIKLQSKMQNHPLPQTLQEWHVMTSCDSVSVLLQFGPIWIGTGIGLDCHDPSITYRQEVTFGAGCIAFLSVFWPIRKLCRPSSWASGTALTSDSAPDRPSRVVSCAEMLGSSWINGSKAFSFETRIADVGREQRPRVEYQSTMTSWHKQTLGKAQNAYNPITQRFDINNMTVEYL